MTNQKPTEAEIARYVRSQQAAHGAAESQRIDSMLAEEQRRQCSGMKAYRAKLERKSQGDTEQYAKQREAERQTQLDKQLEPIKEQRFKEWQAENPTLSRTAFESKVWPVTRESLVGSWYRLPHDEGNYFTSREDLLVAVVFTSLKGCCAHA